MKHFVFILTMPNCGSWNGQWTGEKDLYCVCRSYPEKSEQITKFRSKQNHYYNFGDGWCANIEIKEISAREKTQYKKRSAGFCGYEWMIKEIETFGRIKSLAERQQESRLQEFEKGLKHA